jgi:AcrR family transcriptional regulator
MCSTPDRLQRHDNGALEPKQARSLATRGRLLDAAVDELMEPGYAKLTTASVATRAGVSRGAQQHHFPRKATLVGEAIRHLAELQLEQVRAGTGRDLAGRARAERVLDLFYDLYSGSLFTAMLELTLAARGDEELAALVEPVDRDVSRAVQEHAAALFGDTAAALPDFDLRLGQAMSTIRGLALLRFLGRPKRATDRQWRFTRADLAQLMTHSE